jgi:hypothetical protein
MDEDNQWLPLFIIWMSVIFSFSIIQSTTYTQPVDTYVPPPTDIYVAPYIAP